MKKVLLGKVNILHGFSDNKEKAVKERYTVKNGRLKMRVCLTGIVLAAVIIGMIYYCSVYEEQYIQDEGVLVRNAKEVPHGC